MKDEKSWAVIAQLGGLAGYIFPLGNILVPLLIWIIKKDQSKLVGETAKEALNFQLCVTIYFIVLVVLSFTIILLIITVPLMLALAVIQIVYSIIAATKVDKGEAYKYPLSFQIIK